VAGEMSSASAASSRVNRMSQAGSSPRVTRDGSDRWGGRDHELDAAAGVFGARTPGLDGYYIWSSIPYRCRRTNRS
jgi:hypothetical protein